VQRASRMRHTGKLTPPFFVRRCPRPRGQLSWLLVCCLRIVRPARGPRDIDVAFAAPAITGTTANSSGTVRALLSASSTRTTISSSPALSETARWSGTQGRDSLANPHPSAAWTVFCARSTTWTCHGVCTAVLSSLDPWHLGFVEPKPRARLRASVTKYGAELARLHIPGAFGLFASRPSPVLDRPTAALDRIRGSTVLRPNGIGFDDQLRRQVAGRSRMFLRPCFAEANLRKSICPTCHPARHPMAAAATLISDRDALATEYLFDTTRAL